MPVGMLRGVTERVFPVVVETLKLAEELAAIVAVAGEMVIGIDV
jgi:hypothetical protein